MKLAKGEVRKVGPTDKIELSLEKDLIEALRLMESHTKISKSEIVTTALRRFISAHKDYFPEN